MNVTKTKLGLLGTLVLAVAAIPASAASRGDRGRQSNDSRDRRQRVDDRSRRQHDSHNDRRVGRDYHRSRGGIGVQVRIGSGPVLTGRPAVTYVTRTETVLVEPAHYETQTQRVLVRAGHWQERVLPGRTEYLRDSRGNLHEVTVTPDRVEKVYLPPVYETRTARVLVPARYETRTYQMPVANQCPSVYSSPSRQVISTGIGSGLRIMGNILIR